MHAEGNRRAFLHVNNFKNFGDELYWVRTWRIYMNTKSNKRRNFRKLKFSSEFHKIQNTMTTSRYGFKSLFLNSIAQSAHFISTLDTTTTDWRPGGRGFNSRRGRQHSFVKIDREIFSTVILSLPLIQEGQLSFSGGRMCTILINRLED